MWQSQPFTAPDTVWKSILTDTGLSGVNTDHHHWKQEEQVGPYLFCFTWVLLDGKGSIGTPVWTSLLGWYIFWGIVMHFGCSLLNSPEWCWLLKHLPPVGLHCTCFNVCRRKVSTLVKNVQMFTSQIWLEIHQKKQRRPWSWQVRKITLSSSTVTYECCVSRRYVRIIQNSRAQSDMTAGHSF